MDGPGRLWLRRIGSPEAGCFLELLAKSIRELLVRADALGTSLGSRNGPSQIPLLESLRFCERHHFLVSPTVFPQRSRPPVQSSRGIATYAPRVGRVAAPIARHSRGQTRPHSHSMRVEAGGWVLRLHNGAEVNAETDLANGTRVLSFDPDAIVGLVVFGAGTSGGEKAECPRRLRTVGGKGV